MSTLAALGVTTVWLSPVFRQRGHLDSYHGYGVQDFLEVDSRFGSRDDLVELVAQAHQPGLRVLLDVIFNHSGANWLYPPGTPGGQLKAACTSGQYPFGEWLGDNGQAIMTITGGEDGVWPTEFADPARYTRAGTGSLDASKFPDVDQAEFRRTDFDTGLCSRCPRNIELSSSGVHVLDRAHRLRRLPAASRYLNAVGRNLNATLDMGCPGSGHSARPVLIASTRPTRSTNAPRRSRPLVPAFRCCAPGGST